MSQPPPPPSQPPPHHQQQPTQPPPGAPNQPSAAASAFNEVRAAVTGASKRQPYPFLAVGAAAATAIWLLLPENDKLGAENLKLWTVMVVAAALLLFAPIVRSTFKLSEDRAWRFCAGGAIGLGFAWVAFLLPAINTNHAFFGTIAAVCAGLATWTAPGRPQ
jgi:hypothetical protein